MNGVKINVASILVVFFLTLHQCVGRTVEDLYITVADVAGQSLTFDTGPGMPGGAVNTVQIQIFDKCRVQGQGRKDQGYWFPTSTVAGIEADASGVTNVPGTGNTITYRFLEGIEENADVYTKLDATTAIISFCIQVGLYTNNYLVNWEEVRIHFDIDLMTDINNQGDPLVFVSSAEGFVASAQDTGLDENQMVGYFCDPKTLRETDPESAVMTQGSTITTCFEVVDDRRRSLQNGGNSRAQFEMKDIMDLLIKDLGDSQAAQSIIVANQNAKGVGFAQKACRKKGKTQVTCSVSFLLKADFYDYNAAQLTGEGAAVVELGEGQGRTRRQLVRFGLGSGAYTDKNGLRRLAGANAVAPTSVKPTAFKVEHKNFGRKVDASGAAAMLRSAMGMARAALVLVAVSGFMLI